MRPLFLLAFVLAFHVSLLAQTTEYSHGDPTNDEQYMLELVNRARANPSEEGVLVIDTDDPAVQASYNYWQINKSATKQAFTTYPQRPPLAFHPSLLTAARKHTADMIANNFQGHTGSDGSTLGQRFAREGYASQGMYGENVGAYSNSVWFGHCGLIVDWGTQNQIDLGHRRNILNFDSQVYTEIGIGITNSGGGLNQGTVGPYVITQDFGVRNILYITGVCYNDLNKNGGYDPGEGLAGVRIQPSSGSYHAITSSSGGYAIPYSGGSTTVVASGGGLTSPISKNVDFAGESFKVDFVPAAQLPGSITLLAPANNAIKIVKENVLFDWNTTQFANEYEIMVAKQTSFVASSIVFTQKAATTGATATMPLCATKYYWRVRAVNDAGNGAWSTVYSFTTDGKAPASVTIISPRGAASVDGDKTMPCTWQPSPDATGYHIKFSTHISMADPFAQDSTLTSPTFDLQASLIPPGGMFYWSVRALNACGGSTWSSAVQVNATITGVDEDLLLMGLSVSIAPMPVSEHSVLTISSDVDKVLTLRIVDNVGREVSASQHQVVAGENSIDASMFDELSRGAYTLVITDGQRSVMKAFLR